MSSASGFVSVCHLSMCHVCRVSGVVVRHQTHDVYLSGAFVSNVYLSSVFNFVFCSSLFKCHVTQHPQVSSVSAPESLAAT